MDDRRKLVTFSGMRPSRTFTRFAQCQVEKWIERERTLLFLPSYTSYSVHVNKQTRNSFTCHIEVRIGAREWSGLDEGRSVQDTILNALRSLKPKERIEVGQPPVFSIPQTVSA